MEGFTIIDGVVGLVVAISAILAFSRGFVREVLSIAGWIVAAIVAFVFAAQVEPLVKEIPYVKDFLNTSCELSIIAAFALTFAVALIVVSIFTPLFAAMVQKSALSGLDQGLGFLFGVARGVLLVAIAFVLYDRVLSGDEGIPMVEDSRSRAIMAGAQAKLEENIPNDAPAWIVDRYEQLTGSCQPGSDGDAASSSGTSDS